MSALQEPALAPSLELLDQPTKITNAPTELIETVGRIAGCDIEIECTIERPRDQKHLIDAVPALIAHGYFGAEPAYADYRHELATRGKMAVTWEPARSKVGLSDTNLLALKHPQLLASRAALGVARAVKEQTGYKLFDASGHSNGGQTIAELALHRPDLIRTATFIGSVGLDEHNIITMAPRLCKFLKNDLARLSMAKLVTKPGMINEELKYGLSNPALTLAEMYSAASCSLHERITRMKALGIPAGAINYLADDFFPIDAVEKQSAHLFDDIRRFGDPNMRHTGPQEDPAGTAEMQLDVIASLLKPKIASV